jgi:hypothetical protein
MQIYKSARLVNDMQMFSKRYEKLQFSGGKTGFVFSLTQQISRLEEIIREESLTNKWQLFSINGLKDCIVDCPKNVQSAKSHLKINI